MVESEAVDRAVIECIEQNGELAQILLEHRSEVVNMLLAEFDEEAFIRDIHAEGLAEGKLEGMAVGKLKGKLETVLEDFGALPAELSSRIESETDMGILESWLKAAREAESMEEFIEGMRQ